MLAGRLSLHPLNAVLVTHSSGGEHGSHYEALRRGADEPEWVTGDQGEGRLSGGLEYVHFIRLYNAGGFYDVKVVPMGLADFHTISDSNAAQGTEESIAMRSQHGVSAVPRQRRARKVAGATLQDVLIGPFEYDRRKIQPWDFQEPDDLSSDWRGSERR